MEKSIKRTFLVCKMMQDEMNFVYRSCEKMLISKGKNYVDKIKFLPKGMHKNPKKLHVFLQEQILQEQTADEIILVYGYCGRAMEGLQSPNTKLILPKFDDCIQLMLYDGEREERSLVQKDCLYLTKGWCEDEESILGTCQRITKDYDTEAKSIMEAIYGGYHKIALIDSNAYQIDPVRRQAEKIKEYLDISVMKKSTNLLAIKNLILGNYEKETIIKMPKNQVLNQDYEV